MFDGALRQVIDPPVNAAGHWLARRGARADHLTLAGFVLGMGAAAAVVAGAFWLAFALVALNRVADGLDGAVARATQPTDRGGYLDITLDFVFYGAMPAAFALYDPAANALPAVLVLLSYYANGAAFLAFAVAAQKRGLETEAQGKKSFFYLAGLTEGGETIGVMLLWCALPDYFAPIAFAFAALVAVSAAARIVGGAAALSEARGRKKDAGL